MLTATHPIADGELAVGSHAGTEPLGHSLLAPAPHVAPAREADPFNAGPTGHEGIESRVFQTVLGVSPETAKRVYFGNWQRDVSQVLAPLLAGMPGGATIGELLFAALDVKAQAHFGRRLNRAELGVYRWEEHLDNPREYGVALDPATYRPVVPQRATVTDAPEDRRFGLSMWREDGRGVPGYYLESRRYVIEQLGHALRAGPTLDGLARAGNALHVIEDHFAHSNFVELAMLAVGRPVNPMTGTLAGSSTPIPDVLGRPRLTTGVFPAADTAHSITKMLLEQIEGTATRPPCSSTDSVLRVFVQRLLPGAALVAYDGLQRAWCSALGGLGVTALQEQLHRLILAPLRAALARLLHPLLELQARRTTGLTAYPGFVAGRTDRVMIIETSHALVSKDDPHRPHHAIARELAMAAVGQVWREVAAAFSRGGPVAVAATPLPSLVASIMCHPADAGTWWRPIVGGGTAPPSPVPPPRPPAPAPRPAPRPSAPTGRYGYGYEYAGATCAGGPQPGTQALLDCILRRWPTLRSGGIYSCRPVRGATRLSLHAEGRAIDLMVPTASAPVGADVAGWLITNAPALGVQEVIWDRHIWVATRRNEGWRPYAGPSPHTDHVHVGLLRRAAAGPQRLTPQYLATLGCAGGGPGTVTPPPQPTPTGTPQTVRRGSVGPAVTELQRRLNTWAARSGRRTALAVDGILGPITDAAVRAFQGAHRLAADGIVGPKTWGALAAYR